MKLVLAVLLCVSYPAFAADPWTTADTYREAAFLVVDAIDWAQTRNMARSGWWTYKDASGTGYTSHYALPTNEQNHFLGNYPTVRQVDRYFVLESLSHVVIAYLLPRDWREGFQYVSIGVEAAVVRHNYSIGMSAKF